MANALGGTLKLVAMACGIGLPVGVLAGVFLSEFRQSSFATVVRFSADVMAGIPSITIGMVVYTVVVRPMSRFSARRERRSGDHHVADVTRTTEELLRLVPENLREARSTRPAEVARRPHRSEDAPPESSPGDARGSRIGGETTPSIYGTTAAFGAGAGQPVACSRSVTPRSAPYEDWHRQSRAARWSWSMTLLLNVTAKFRSQPIDAR